MRSRVPVIVGVLVLLALPLVVLAHGGGLDGFGGHRDNIYGGYHFHQGPLAGQTFASREAAYEAYRKFQEAQKAPRVEPTPPPPLVVPREPVPEPPPAVRPAPAEAMIAALDAENRNLKVRVERLENRQAAMAEVIRQMEERLKAVEEKAGR